MDIRLINLLLVLLLAWTAGLIAKRFRFPVILGELSAGILFGPALLGILEDTDSLKVLSEVGLFLMMLYIGLEVDYRAVFKGSKWGFLAAFGGFAVPFGAGFLLGRYLGYSDSVNLVLAVILSTTSLAVISRILADLHLIGTRVGQVILVGALVCDVLALLSFAIISSFLGPKGFDVEHAIWTIAKAVLFFGVSIFIGIRVFPLFGRLVLRFGLTERTANFTLLLVVATVFAELAEMAGMHSMIGAFITGLFIREEVIQRKLSHEITSLVHDLSLGFLAPIFFITAGFHVDLSVLRSHPEIVFWLFLVGTSGKILGALLFYLPSRRSLTEAISIGVGMTVHGAVEIIIARIALEANFIDQSVFSALVLMIFATTLVSPPFLKLSVQWLRKHNQLARADEHRKGLLILGATPLSIALAKPWQKFGPVRLIDTNLARCLAAQKEGLDAFQGNGLREETLTAVRASEMRAFLAMTGNPDVNQIAAKNASDYFGIPEIHVIFSDKRSWRLSDSESQKEISFKPIFGIDPSSESWNFRILRNETQMEETEVAHDCTRADFLQKLEEKGDVLPLVVARKSKYFLPGIMEELCKGDQLTFLRNKPKDDLLLGRFEDLVRRAPILDFETAISPDLFFEKVSDLLSERLNLDAKTLFDRFHLREQESTTVIMPGLALPHIIVEGQNQTELVIARCKEGLTFWGATNRVQIIFVIAGTRDQRNLHLRILSSIAQLFQDPNFEKRWNSALSEEELRSTILSTKRVRF